MEWGHLTELQNLVLYGNSLRGALSLCILGAYCLLSTWALYVAFGRLVGISYTLVHRASPHQTTSGLGAARELRDCGSLQDVTAIHMPAPVCAGSKQACVETAPLPLPHYCHPHVLFTRALRCDCMTAPRHRELL